MAVDLAVQMAGFKFKNPVLPGPSELVSTVFNVERMIKTGVGGMTTKTYTSLEAPRVRMHPNFFVMKGRGFEQAYSFHSFGGGNWPEHIDIIIKRDIPRFKKMCREAGLPLIVTWYQPFGIVDGKPQPGVAENWADTAKRMADAGADIQELNFSCPLVSDIIREFPWATAEIADAVVRTGVPTGIKISPIWEPLEKLSLEWEKTGIKFITAHNVAFTGLIIDVEAEMPRYAPGIGSFLPGRFLLPWSLSRVARLCKVVKIPVIGVGGITTVEDALQYLLCGAHMVQICSAAYFQGPKIFTKTINGIQAWMEKKGYQTIADFRGKALSRVFPAAEVRKREEFPFNAQPDLPFAPVVDKEKCSVCGMCEACVFAVYRMEDKKLLVDESKCQGCGFCVTLCPKNAITLIDKRDNSVVWNGRDVMPSTQRKAMEQILAGTNKVK